MRILDELTQHNAALVEETNNAAIEQTEAQAITLDQIAGIFVLSDNKGLALAQERPRNRAA